MPSLLRRCRFCGSTNEWNSQVCGACNKKRWNDPDDTELGRELGELERTNYEVALAAAKLEDDDFPRR